MFQGGKETLASDILNERFQEYFQGSCKNLEGLKLWKESGGAAY